MIAKTYQRTACNGDNLYITINRKENGEFVSILIHPPAKTNDCGGSYAYALQDLATFALRRAEGEKDLKLIIKALSGHFCNACPPNKHHGKSCTDYLAQILKEEMNGIPEKVV